MRRDFEPRAIQEKRNLPLKPEVSFFFSAHGVPEDYAGIEAAFEAADVYVVESHGWTQEDLDRLRAMSRGEIKPKHMENGHQATTAVEYENELIFNSGKQIEIVDVPKGHELEKEDDGNSLYWHIADRFFNQGNVEEALSSLDEATKKAGEYINKKDAFIRDELNALLKRLEQEKDVTSEPVKVLVQMGATHTAISHDLRKEKNADRIKNVVQFDYFDQLVRSHRFNKPIVEELMLKGFAESLLKKVYYDELEQYPYLKRKEFFERTLETITKEQLTQLGEIIKEDFFNRIVMNQEEDTPESQRQMFESAWQNVMGTDIGVLIKELAT